MQAACDGMMIGLLKRQPLIERWRARRYFWKSYNVNGEWELRQLPVYVPKNRSAIDVGGNIGIYSYHLGRLARRVITFEPNPLYADRLRRIGLGKDLKEVALSDRSGTAELRIPFWKGREDAAQASLETDAVPGSMLARTVQVSVRRLDDYGFQGVGFIKIDVEGHEESVLRGGVETLSRERPVLLIEIEQRHNPGGLERIRALLSGYRGFFFLNRQKLPLTDFDVSVHQRMEDLETAFTGRRRSPYVNNFLFLPAR